MTSKELVRRGRAQMPEYARKPDAEVLAAMVRAHPLYLQMLDDAPGFSEAPLVADRLRPLGFKGIDKGNILEPFMPNYAARKLDERMQHYASVAESIQRMTAAELQSFLNESAMRRARDLVQEEGLLAQLKLQNDIGVLAAANAAGMPLTIYVQKVEGQMKNMLDVERAEAEAAAKMRLQQLEREQAVHLAGITNTYAEDMETIKAKGKNARDRDEIENDALAGVTARGVLMKKELTIIREIAEWEHLRLSATSPTQLRYYAESIDAREKELVGVRAAIAKVSGG